MNPPYIPADLTSERAGPILADWTGEIEVYIGPDTGWIPAATLRGIPVFALHQMLPKRLNPDRPEVRDHCARWLGRAHGLEIGATAPGWRRFRLGRPDGSESWAWALLGAPGEQFFFTDGNVPGISALTDPAEALAAAILHAGGRHRDRRARRAGGSVTKAETDVLAEREKQRAKWGDEHDDEHDPGDLADVARLLANEDFNTFNLDLKNAGWGVRLYAKHGTNRRQRLVIAAALLIAEIERLDRAGGE